LATYRHSEKAAMRRAFLCRLIQENYGVTAIEYGLIAALIAAAATVMI
jgi:Flp pilus assembly pilin Flp